jgi:hypothetical protein
MLENTACFEIRDKIPGSHNENDFIQAGYDLINLTVCVWGNLTFKEIFTQPWGVLIPRVEANVCSAIKRKLIKKPELVLDYLSCLEEMGDMTFQGLMSGSQSPRILAASKTLFDMWRFGGVALPMRPFRPSVRAESRAALAELLMVAPDFCYVHLFTTTRIGCGKEISQAISNAIDLNLIIMISDNSHCCTNGTGCQSAQASFCSLEMVGGRLGCVTGSTGCNGPRRRRR